MPEDKKQEIQEELEEVDDRPRPSSAEPGSPPSEQTEGGPSTPREMLRRAQFEILYSEEHAQQVPSEGQAPADTDPAPEEEGSDPPRD